LSKGSTVEAVKIEPGIGEQNTTMAKNTIWGRVPGSVWKNYNYNVMAIASEDKSFVSGKSRAGVSSRKGQTLPCRGDGNWTGDVVKERKRCSFEEKSGGEKPSTFRRFVLRADPHWGKRRGTVVLVETRKSAGMISKKRSP